jgi:hypothetical protein
MPLAVDAEGDRRISLVTSEIVDQCADDTLRQGYLP